MCGHDSACCCCCCTSCWCPEVARMLSCDSSGWRQYAASTTLLQISLSMTMTLTHIEEVSRRQLQYWMWCVWSLECEGAKATLYVRHPPPRSLGSSGAAPCPEVTMANIKNYDLQFYNNKNNLAPHKWVGPKLSFHLQMKRNISRFQAPRVCSLQSVSRPALTGASFNLIPNLDNDQKVIM